VPEEYLPHARIFPPDCQSSTDKSEILTGASRID
jgi:hypothetical protein